MIAYKRGWKSRVRKIINVLKDIDLSKFLNTDTIGKVLPTIASRYGKGHGLEFMMSTNPDIFREGSDAPVSGVYFGKDGMITARLNVHIDLRLQESKQTIRHIYIPIEVQVQAPEPLKYFSHNDSFVVSYKFVNAEIKGLKVFSLQPPKLEKNEAMLI